MPLTLDLGRFAEFDDQLSLGESASDIATAGQGGYMYALYAIVVHDGGMCVTSSIPTRRGQHIRTAVPRFTLQCPNLLCC